MPFTTRRPRSITILFVGGFFAAVAGISVSTDVFADENERRPPVLLEDVALGELNIKDPMLRARRITMPPGHKTPTHKHEGPGIRYVLDGEITIYWKDGTKHSYGPGETYFEGRGENHPPHDMAAANEGDKPVTILIVDIHPRE